MAFINEFIPEADVEKYGIKEINFHFNKSSFKPGWTIDRERDIYLRKLLQGRDEFSNQQSYHLYWKGTLIYLNVAIQGKKSDESTGEFDYKLLEIEIPDAITSNRDEILRDLKAALTESSGGGVYRTIASCNATFDF